MFVRIITLLLAVMMMMGSAGQVCTSSGAPSAVCVDDTLDLDTPVLPAPVTVPLPSCQEPVCIEAFPACAGGRMHAVLVFRPPRRVAFC